MLDHVTDLCFRVRRWAAPRWLEWRDLLHPNCDLPLPAGLCGAATVLLREVLTAEVLDIEWFSTGGETDQTIEGLQGGMVPLNGWRPMAHAWVEGVCTDGSSLIADITADQFGYAEVIVTSTEDRRYHRTYPLETGATHKLVTDTIGLAWAADYALSSGGADISVRTHTDPAIDAIREERRRFYRGCS